MKKIIFCILILLAFTFISCKDDYGLNFDAKPKKEKSQPRPSIVEQAQKAFDSFPLVDVADAAEDKIDLFVDQLITGSSYGSPTSKFQITRDGELIDGTERITFYIVNDKQSYNSYLLINKRNANIVIIQLDGE